MLTTSTHYYIPLALDVTTYNLPQGPEAPVHSQPQHMELHLLTPGAKPLYTSNLAPTDRQLLTQGLKAPVHLTPGPTSYNTQYWGSTGETPVYKVDGGFLSKG